jgi:hypothetical protein
MSRFKTETCIRPWVGDTNISQQTLLPSPAQEERQNAMPKTMLKVKGFVAGPLAGLVEAEDKIAFDKVSLEEGVFYRPALDDQRRDCELRRLRLVRIDQESYPASSGKAVPQPPQEPGIYNKLNFSWLVHDDWDEFEVKVHSPASVDCDRNGKRHLEGVSQGSSVIAVVSYQRKAEAGVPADGLLLRIGQARLARQ